MAGDFIKLGFLAQGGLRGGGRCWLFGVLALVVVVVASARLGFLAQQGGCGHCTGKS